MWRTEKPTVGVGRVDVPGAGDVAGDLDGGGGGHGVSRVVERLTARARRSVVEGLTIPPVGWRHEQRASVGDRCRRAALARRRRAEGLAGLALQHPAAAPTGSTADLQHETGIAARLLRDPRPAVGDAGPDAADERARRPLPVLAQPPLARRLAARGAGLDAPPGLRGGRPRPARRPHRRRASPRSRRPPRSTSRACAGTCSTSSPTSRSRRCATSARRCCATSPRADAAEPHPHGGRDGAGGGPGRQRVDDRHVVRHRQTATDGGIDEVIAAARCTASSSRSSTSTPAGSSPTRRWPAARRGRWSAPTCSSPRPAPPAGSPSSTRSAAPPPSAARSSRACSPR